MSDHHDEDIQVVYHNVLLEYILTPMTDKGRRFIRTECPQRHTPFAIFASDKPRERQEFKTLIEKGDKQGIKFVQRHEGEVVNA